MSENKSKFRVVTMGGFHKDDVLTYIASIEHKVTLVKDDFAIEKKAMQKELEDAMLKIEEFQPIYNEYERLRMENAELKRVVQEINTADFEETISKLRLENSDLRFNIQQLSNNKNDLSKIKETVIQLELDAHLRAKAVEEKSKEDAEEILLVAYQQAKEIEKQSEYKIDELQNKVFNITSQTNTEFAKIDEILLLISEKNEELRQEMLSFGKVFEEKKETEVNEIYELL